ncbi:MAG: rhomboid family intramembrane serine protease [Phycisphaerales bacterium]
MLIPLTTDRPQRTPPVATWVLMLVNLALFIVMVGVNARHPGTDNRLQEVMAFDPIAFGLHPTHGAVLTDEGANRGQWWTLFTYQFAHAGWFHVLGNLLILWVFGPGIEDRFGKIGFTVFYLLGGVLAALVHGLFHPNPVVGASGAIAAVTGAFLVLFPRTHIKVLLFFVLVGVYELPAWVFIVFAVAKDIWGVGTGGSDVAFLAHLGGYVYGFTIAMLLLMTRLLPQEDWSLFAIAKHAKRRADFKASAREADAEWKRRVESKRPTTSDKPLARESEDSGRTRTGPAGVEERILWQRMEAGEAEAASVVESERVATLRASLAAKVESGDGEAASEALRVLLKEARGAVGSRRVLVDAGNLFVAVGKHGDAAAAYEAFLGSLRGAPDSDENRVRLMLALVYQRYLKDPSRATRALAGIKGAFSDSELHALADSLRTELRAGRQVG